MPIKPPSELERRPVSAQDGLDLVADLVPEVATLAPFSPNTAQSRSKMAVIDESFSSPTKAREDGATRNDTDLEAWTPQRPRYTSSGIGLTPVTDELLQLQLSSAKKKDGHDWPEETAIVQEFVSARSSSFTTAPVGGIN